MATGNLVQLMSPPLSLNHPLSGVSLTWAPPPPFGQWVFVHHISSRVVSLFCSNSGSVCPPLTCSGRAFSFLTRVTVWCVMCLYQLMWRGVAKVICTFLIICSAFFVWKVFWMFGLVGAIPSSRQCLVDPLVCPCLCLYYHHWDNCRTRVVVLLSFRKNKTKQKATGLLLWSLP